MNKNEFPFTIGFEGAGEIQELYGCDTNLKHKFPPGARVAFRNTQVFAEFCLVKVENLHKVDSSVDYKYMAGSTINPYTALYAL